MKIYTIGVYGSTEEEFFGKLTKFQIDLFCDIRQRRGVRGRQYAFVNSSYLQKKLSDLGIGYLYEKRFVKCNGQKTKRNIRQRKRVKH